jgi:hypothetical protein
MRREHLAVAALGRAPCFVGAKELILVDGMFSCPIIAIVRVGESAQLADEGVAVACQTGAPVRLLPCLSRNGVAQEPERGVLGTSAGRGRFGRSRSGSGSAWTSDAC